MDGIQRMALFIILIQIQQQVHGYGLDHTLKQLENIDSVNNLQAIYEQSKYNI